MRNNKKISLKAAVLNYKYCLGFIWRLNNGLYDYQNDNDLGLDVDELKGLQKVTKIYIDKKYYIYQLKGVYEDEGNGEDLATIKAVLKDCHSNIFKLTPTEKKLSDKYFNKE